jgi:LytS/YehU family sensor histidine kinase
MGVVFQFLDVCDFNTYVVFVKVLITLGLVGLTGIMYLSDEGGSGRGVYSGFVANAVLTVGSILEAILSIFKFYSAYDGIVLQISIYIFLVLLVVTVEKGIISEMSQSAKIAINEIEQEKDMAIKNVNTDLIFKALAQAAGRLKANNMPEGKLVYDTSVYMKCNLRAAADRQLVPFKQELEYIKAYLGIQTKRFKDLDVSVEDKISNFKVPYNTIEPIVENSVENGALKSASSGRFVLRSYERLDCYAIQIVDNGPGISPEKEFYGNVDYKTVKKRLKSECQAVVDVKCRPGKGMIITVKIPKDGYVIKE